MHFQNPSANTSARIRALWHSFEHSQATDRAHLDTTVMVALAKAEAEWKKTPNSARMSRIKFNASKAQLAKALRTSYFEQARAKWEQKLQHTGLKVEYWTDLTEDEKGRIINILGADDESDEDLVVVPELPPPPPPPPIAQPPPVAPSFSTSSRATNLSSSSYAFVNPSEFNSEEEDLEYDFPFSNPVATSGDLTSEDDDDPAFSILGYPPQVTAPSVGFSRASSLHNSTSNPPNPRPLSSGFAFNAGLNQAAPPKRPQNEVKSAPTKAKIPRQPYIGPTLDATDEPVDEELAFEKFKMRTRMEKIVEFHEAAALAEISLSIEIYKARRQLNNSKEEDAPRVLEHQKRMVQLQKEKEEERKAIVKSERARRQSDLGRHRAVKELPTAFKTWALSSFQEEMPHDLPSRFDLDNLLSYDPEKQQMNVDNLLSEMFSNDSQPWSDASAPTHSYSSASSNQVSIHDTQEQLRQGHPSMSWNKPQSNSPPKQPPRKAHLSLFGESSDEEPAPVRHLNGNTEPVRNNKPNTPVSSAWSSKDVSVTPVSSGWTSKKATPPITQPLQGLSNPNPFFVADEIEPELTATNSKVAKGKKAWASDKSPVFEATAKVPAVETPVDPPKVDNPTPVAPAPTPAPAPAGKKQNKKQRQVNKKAGTVVAPTAVAEPVMEPETEPVPPSPRQQASPKLEPPVPAVDPVFQASEHTSWLPKMVPAMARARMDSGSSTPSLNWDEATSTPRPAPKIPVHIQEALKSQTTPRPSMLKKQTLTAEVFSATSSRTTLEQMPSIAKEAWGSVPFAPSPGPSLWGRTKADFETLKVAQQPAGGEFWVPGGVDVYNDEGGGGGGNGGSRDDDVSVPLWESMATHSKQIGKPVRVPVKPSVTAQRPRRASEAAAAASPAPRVLGTKDLSDIGQPPPNPNPKKARAKKNGKGKERVTIEDVSDEEKDNIDILPPDSSFIMEPKVILEPKPSVPPVVYSSIFDYAGNDVNHNNASSSSSFRLTTTTSRSSPDDILSGNESLLSNPFKIQGATKLASSDWTGKHARWTPAVSHDSETSGSPPTFSASSFGSSRLQAKPPSVVQQTPIWGQPIKLKRQG